MYKLLTYLLQSLRSSPFVCTNINFPSELHSYSNVILNIAQNMHIMNNCKRQRKNLFISNLVTKKEGKKEVLARSTPPWYYCLIIIIFKFNIEITIPIEILLSEMSSSHWMLCMKNINMKAREGNYFVCGSFSESQQSVDEVPPSMKYWGMD